MDAVPGAMSVPLRSLPHEKSRAVNRSLTYDSALEDAQCPYMREKDMAPSRATEPAAKLHASFLFDPPDKEEAQKRQKPDLLEDLRLQYIYIHIRPI